MTSDSLLQCTGDEETMSSRRYLYITAATLGLSLLFFPGRCRGTERQIDPSGSELVASVLKAYGGEGAVRKVMSVTAKGRITEFLNGKEGNYARYFERPGKLRIEVMPEQGGEIRILNKNHGWHVGSGGLVPVSPLVLQSMIYQYSYLDLPMGLADGSLQVKYGGKQSHNGRDGYLLLIELKKAPQLRLLIDAKTHLIVKVSSTFAMGMMGAGELSTEYSDFHAIDGVLFPFRLINFAGDMKLSEIVLSEITINRKIPAEFFAPK